LEFGTWNLGLGSLKAKSLFSRLGIWALEFGFWDLGLTGSEVVEAKNLGF
jgi:hypothetical protein